MFIKVLRQYPSVQQQKLDNIKTKITKNNK
jgi:phage terminase Nu1 subunit (DNA packaging protein)